MVASMHPTPALTAGSVSSSQPGLGADLAIPRITHQTWRSQELPPRFADWRRAWRALHPDWEHRFYDDDDIHRLVRDRAPQWLSAFERLPRQIQRVDMFRYLAVYLDGGLYADLDMIPFQPSDRLLEGASCVFSIEHHLGPRLQRELGYRLPWQIANCIFAAAPGHPFFAELLEHIARHASRPVDGDDDVEDITGPRMLTRLAFALPPERRGDIRILPQIHWMPPSEFVWLGRLGRHVYARHATAGSWRTDRAPHWWYHELSWKRLRGSFAMTGPVLS